MSVEERRLLSGSQNRPPFINGKTTRMMPRAMPKGRMSHICIVGAGLAGLRCAQILCQKGLEVTILEGRDRIGGRVSRSSAHNGTRLTDDRFIR